MRERKRSRRSVQSMLMPLLVCCGAVLTRRAPPRLQLIAACRSVRKICRGEKTINLADYSAYFLERSRSLGRGVDRRAGLLLQFFQLFLQERQARDQRAISLIRDRLLLHLSPSRVGILFVPRTLGLDVECSLRGEIIK